MLKPSGLSVSNAGAGGLKTMLTPVTVLPGDIQQLPDERYSVIHVFGKLLRVQQSGIEVVMELVFDDSESSLKTWRQVVLP